MGFGDQKLADLTRDQKIADALLSVANTNTYPQAGYYQIVNQPIPAPYASLELTMVFNVLGRRMEFDYDNAAVRYNERKDLWEKANHPFGSYSAESPSQATQIFDTIRQNFATGFTVVFTLYSIADYDYNELKNIHLHLQGDDSLRMDYPQLNINGNFYLSHDAVSAILQWVRMWEAGFFVSECSVPFRENSEEPTINLEKSRLVAPMFDGRGFMADRYYLRERVVRF
ncbi:hypothetical protein SPFM15_00209 [Salmonella phage SPFM15]|nr:hypothetical protein SPFM5_00204 [Salmonella phage SPFM5]VFR13833.1 hypothetical protein SPFM15_00209 [Salmonella phage SPFM15]